MQLMLHECTFLILEESFEDASVIGFIHKFLDYLQAFGKTIGKITPTTGAAIFNPNSTISPLTPCSYNSNYAAIT